MHHRREKLACTLAVMTFVVACLLSACGENPATKPRLEKKTVPLVTQLDKDTPVEQSEMNLYFVNGGDVPYVALSEYMPLFGGFYEDQEKGQTALEFEFEHEGTMTRVERTDNGYSMYLDPSSDHLSFDSYDGFIQAPGNDTLVSVVALGEDGFDSRSKILQGTGSSYNRDGLLTDFDLSKYSIDLIESDGTCYLPLQTMSDVLLARNYIRSVYNGEKVFFFAYGCDLNDQILGVERPQMSQGLAEFNLNELAFLIDRFYGLKAEHGIDDPYKLFADTGLLESLSSTDPNEFDKGLALLTGRYLDDLHSGLTARSIGSDAPQEGLSEEESAFLQMQQEPGASIAADGTATDYYSGLRAQYLKDAVAGADEDGPFLYEEVGDTAIVTFDTFKIGKDDYHKQADLDNPQDTIELVAKAHREITRKGSPIKNVVIDLSCNGGGDGDAAAFVIAWFAGPRQLGMRDTLTGAQSICSYAADVNLDGKFNQKDTLYHKAMKGELNLYCLITSKSFSCGNLVPAAFKGTGCIKLLGETSGGGACMVMPCTSASGAQFQISGPMQISTVKNGSFYNVDAGIDPDVAIAKAQTYYDRAQLVELIHGLK